MCGVHGEVKDQGIRHGSKALYENHRNALSQGCNKDKQMKSSMWQYLCIVSMLVSYLTIVMYATAL